jgi:hypothetical protein
MVLGSGFRRNDNGFWVLAFAGMTTVLGSSFRWNDNVFCRKYSEGKG